MKNLLLISLAAAGFASFEVKAQIKPPPQPTAYIQNYFTPENQTKEVARMQDLILSGCTVDLKKQPAIGQDEMAFNVDQVKMLIHSKFSKSFEENSLIKEMMDNALNAIAVDPSCAKEGNDCRTRLVATATYYYQNLRPNMPGCDGYVKYDYTTSSAKKKRAEENGYIKECEAEIQLRGQKLSGYGRSNGGMDQRGAYSDELVNELNKVTRQIQMGVLGETTGKNVKKKKVVGLDKHPYKMDICGEVQSGVVYAFPLRVNLYGEPFAGYDPAKKVTTTPEPKKDPVSDKKPEPCAEEIKVLHEEFVPMNFEEGSSTVKGSEVKPVKQKIEDFVSSHSSLVITNIDVTSSSSKTPFYKTVNGEKVYDKEYSDAKNLELAKSRANFAQTALDSIKSGHPELGDAKYTSVGAINGPDFDKDDLADRKVTSKSPEYKALVEKIYAEYKDMLAKDAMIKSSKELLDSKRFANLYDVKYKPYQGFKIVISGYSKETRKCGDKEQAVDQKASGQTEVNKSAPGNSQK
jgi:hypothetical protein